MEIATQYKAAQLSAKSQALLNNKAGGKANINEGAMKAAKEFEAVFITNMLENMYTGIEAEEPFGGGHAEKIYRSMQIAEYGKELGKNGGIGLADNIYRELLATQEGVR